MELEHINKYCKAVLYSEIKDDIRNYFDPRYKAVIVLILLKPTFGHYILLYEDPKNTSSLCLWDSFGTPEYMTKFKLSDTNALAQNQKPFGLKKACMHYKVLEFNDYCMQKDHEQTCGQWCLKRLVNRQMTNLEFYKNFRQF